MDEFDELLISIIDGILKETFGEETTETIHDYLEKKGLARSEIPKKLNVCFSELMDILGIQESHIGIGRSITVMGTVSLLEVAIAKKLCRKLGVEFDKDAAFNGFSDYIAKLKKIYHHYNNKSIRRGKQETP